MLPMDCYPCKFQKRFGCNRLSPCNKCCDEGTRCFIVPASADGRCRECQKEDIKCRGRADRCQYCTKQDTLCVYDGIDGHTQTSFGSQHSSGGLKRLFLDASTSCEQCYSSEKASSADNQSCGASFPCTACLRGRQTACSFQHNDNVTQVYYLNGIPGFSAKAKKSAKDTIEAIGIRGVPWQVPRIDTKHFTVTQLQDVLHRVCEPVALSQFHHLSRTEFVWLDIACIDQRWGPLPALEIGRQANIFKQASGVAAWLSQVNRRVEAKTPNLGKINLGHDEKLLSWDEAQIKAASPQDRKRYLKAESRRNRIERAQKNAAVSLSVESEQSSKAFFLTLTSCTLEELWNSPASSELRKLLLKGVEKLLVDPWFSSLWTLQEAFLRRDAYFLSAHAELIPVTKTSEAGSNILTLELLCASCTKIADECIRPLAEDAWKQQSTGDIIDRDRDPTERERFERQWPMYVSGAGLREISKQNPLLLWAIANKRKASNDMDRVYGIMQVFNYQLGSAADPTRSFTVPELVDQLGEALLQDRPVESQLVDLGHFTDPGKAWHLNSSSTVPSFYMLSSEKFAHAADYPRPICHLSTRTVLETKFGHVQGKACYFQRLCESWERTNLTARHKGYRTLNKTKSVVRLALDQAYHIHSPEKTPMEGDETWDVPEVPDDPSRQRRVWSWLRDRYDSNHLIVILLGQSSDWTYGLILLHVRVQGMLFWHRLGTCMWHHTSDHATKPDKRLMCGKSDYWIDMEGLFG